MPVEAVSAPATAKTPKFIHFDTSSFAAHITLNHPPYNVLSVPMMTELAEAIESLNGRPEIKCIVLDAAQDPKVPQKMFSAGISLEDSQSDRVFQTLETFYRIFLAIRVIS
jgi:enoyl-CoA hydratase/carnithine racemase